jgi:hypothetical protein
MPKAIKPTKRLSDTYAFEGFRPLSSVRGVFGDPRGRVIALVRRSKKRCAAVAEKCSTVGTTVESARFEICPVGIRECPWSSRCAGFFVEAVAK